MTYETARAALDMTAFLGLIGVLGWLSWVGLQSRPTDNGGRRAQS